MRVDDRVVLHPSDKAEALGMCERSSEEGSLQQEAQDAAARVVCVYTRGTQVEQPHVGVARSVEGVGFRHRKAEGHQRGVDASTQASQLHTTFERKRAPQTEHTNQQKTLLREALNAFYEIRDVPGMKKKPSTSELLDWLKLLVAEDIPPEALRSSERKSLIPPLYGALLKNDQDVQLFERLAFLDRQRNA